MSKRAIGVAIASLTTFVLIAMVWYIVRHGVHVEIHNQ